jgi:hypothetical protein
LEYLRDNTKLDPLRVSNQNMGNIMEKGNWQNKGMGGMAMGKCEDGQIKSLYNKTIYEHFQGWHGRLQFP